MGAGWQRWMRNSKHAAATAWLPGRLVILQERTRNSLPLTSMSKFSVGI